MKEKRRVRCANCGMIWDTYIGSAFTQVCPSCKSNAYDVVEKQPPYQYPEKWKPE